MPEWISVCMGERGQTKLVVGEEGGLMYFRLGVLEKVCYVTIL